MENNFSISENAANRIVEVASRENNDKGLRILVYKGGCKGMKYKLNFVNTINEDDITFNKGKALVMIDSDSMEFLENCSLDYVEDISGSKFVIDNPIAKTTCHCGSSFTI